MDETGPGELMQTAATPRKRYLRFDPTITSGMIIQIIVVLLGGVITYGVYQADRALAAREVEYLKTSVQDMKQDVKSMQDVLTTLTRTLAVMEARQQARSELGK